MRICIARTQTDRPEEDAGAKACARRAHARAFTLVELIVVLTLLGLLIMVAQTNLFGVLRRQGFKSQVQDFVSAMQMAAFSAAENGRRYEVIIDPTDQSYLLREITSSDLSEVLEEEIITQGQFGTSCRLSYVEFDDGTYTNSDRSKFRVGPAGWTYGGKIVLLDEGEEPHAVIVNRLLPTVELVTGDPPLLTPKGKDEVPFL
ncbi:MAG: prepilin-type N-terminal cleavage/methylation domain-containing protein [Planctomycetes bacterium]|nr:prepilin-type N-terminal cleavage/methylation domain-containing protein [Planctomycetota bacterium]